MFVGDAFDRLLDDVIAILVLHAFHYVIVEFPDEAYLLINKHMLESLDGSVSARKKKKKRKPKAEDIPFEQRDIHTSPTTEATHGLSSCSPISSSASDRHVRKIFG